MKNPLISVIIPVYNVADLLPRCLDSLINQSYPHLEILVIDDGSSDESAAIALDYANRDSRIKVIRKTNGGQGSARNRGLAVAQGDYITFVDSDDWINNDIYAHTVQLISQYDPDVVSFNSVETNGEEVHQDSDQYEIINITGTEDILVDYLNRGQTDKAPFTVWRKLFKKNLLTDVRFDEELNNEDILFVFWALKNATSIIHTDKLGYYYYQGNKSTTRNGLRERDFDLLTVSDQLIEESESFNNRELIYLSKVKKARTYFSLLAKIAFYGIESDELDKPKTVKDLTRDLRKNYLFLIKSPMPANRKVMVTLLAVNIRCLSWPLRMFKSLKK